MYIRPDTSCPCVSLCMCIFFFQRKEIWTGSTQTTEGRWKYSFGLKYKRPLASDGAIKMQRQSSCYNVAACFMTLSRSISCSSFSQLVGVRLCIDSVCIAFRVVCTRSFRSNYTNSNHNDERLHFLEYYRSERVPEGLDLSFIPCNPRLDLSLLLRSCATSLRTRRHSITGINIRRLFFYVVISHAEYRCCLRFEKY